MLATKNLISSCKRDLIDIYKHAIDSVKPEKLIHESVEFCGRDLVLKESLSNKIPASTLRYDINGTRIHVVGGGKSVLGMAAALGELAARANMQQKFSHGTISVPTDLRSGFDSVVHDQLDSIGVKCLFGSRNNLPDEESVAATECILENISDACQSDERANLKSLFVVLISGGGSACLTSPRFLTLSAKLEIIKQLVQKGADIVELNKVRRFFSNVKGGRLARHILKCNPSSKIITLILSDVIGDPIEYIASGPTYIDEDDFHRSMTSVMEKYGLRLPKCANITSGSTDRDTSVAHTSIVNRIVGNNNVALKNGLERAKCLGYQVSKLDVQLDGSTSEALKRLLSFSRAGYYATQPTKTLFLAGGETTVKKLDNESWGLGGRVQEFCLDYMISGLSQTVCKDNEREYVDLLLAGSTDGQDGPTDVAACIVSLAEHRMVLEGDNRLKFDLDDCLAAKKSHNSYEFWSKYQPDWLVKTGLTGTNVMDLYFYLEIMDRPSAKNDSKNKP